MICCSGIVNGYVLIDPITGRVRERQSPTIQEERNQMEILEPENLGLQVSQDVQIFGLPTFSPQPRVRVPAPEYYAADGKTPIYKIFRKNPYGR